MQPATTAPPLSGLELMNALLAGDLPAPGFAVTLGIEPIAFAEGRAAFALDPGPEHLSPLGTVHGGILSTLLDSAVGCAIHTTLGARDLFTTVDLDVKFVRPVRSGQQRITAEARTVHVGGRIATAEGRIVDADGTLYAHATTTCLITRHQLAANTA
jgi:uncharacterized protein (TIGR00369 family)